MASVWEQLKAHNHISTKKFIALMSIKTGLRPEKIREILQLFEDAEFIKFTEVQEEDRAIEVVNIKEEARKIEL